MKRFVLISLSLLIVIVLQANDNTMFNENDYLPNTIIFSLREEAINSRRGEIDVSRNPENSKF